MRGTRPNWGGTEEESMIIKIKICVVSRLEMEMLNGLIGYSLTNSLILCFLPFSNVFSFTKFNYNDIWRESNFHSACVLWTKLSRHSLTMSRRKHSGNTANWKRGLILMWAYIWAFLRHGWYGDGSFFRKIFGSHEKIELFFDVPGMKFKTFLKTKIMLKNCNKVSLYFFIPNLVS